MARWVEHYSTLYFVETPVNPELYDKIPKYTSMYELDDEPTEHELSEAINGLTSGKAPGNDKIPTEAIKENKDVLLPHLHKLLIRCWRDGKVPYDMLDSSIVALFKNKGDKGDCNNYRGISLLSVTGKAFARVILKRLQRLAERILPESQCGFRAGG